MNERSPAQQSELIVRSAIIRETYSRWSPPIAVGKIVARLIESLPDEYLAGIKTVVLTDAAGLNYEGRRAKTWTRGRKVLIRKCRGLYHEAHAGETAWIELFVDNIVMHWSLWFLKIPLFADMAFGEVLFHEIGHHMHRTRAPEFREREDVAESWRKRLSRVFFRSRYWYLIPVAYLLRPMFWLKEKLA
jgi:hypothetical protein